MVLSNKKGFTLIELITVIGIIGVLAAISIPFYAQYKARAYDADVKSHLHNVFLACKGYWADEGPNSNCTIPIAKSTTYGYIQTTNITIVASGGEITFASTASHADSGNSYSIDSLGSIS